MKRLAALAAVLPILITACVPTGAPVGCRPPAQRQKVYFNESLGYCFVYPESFTLTTPTEQSVKLTQKTDAGVEVSLVVEVTPADGAVVDQIAKQLADQMSTG